MTTDKRMRELVTTSGFTITGDAGLFHGERDHVDGRHQILQVFYWTNPKHAAKVGIPHGYLALRGQIDEGGSGTGASTLRLPTYEWPAEDPTRRPWPEVLEEFRTGCSPSGTCRSRSLRSTCSSFPTDTGSDYPPSRSEPHP